MNPYADDPDVDPPNPWSRYSLPARVFVTARSKEEAERIARAHEHALAVLDLGPYMLCVYPDHDGEATFETEDAIIPTEE